MPSPTEEVEVSSENVDKLSDTKSHPQVTDPKPNTESMIETESIQEKKTENSKEGARLECKSYFISHCVKSVQIRSHFWSVFPAFRLNMERYYLSVFSLNAGK